LVAQKLGKVETQCESWPRMGSDACGCIWESWQQLVIACWWC